MTDYIEQNDDHRRLALDLAVETAKNAPGTDVLIMAEKYRQFLAGEPGRKDEPKGLNHASGSWDVTSGDSGLRRGTLDEALTAVRLCFACGGTTVTIRRPG